VKLIGLLLLLSALAAHAQDFTWVGYPSPRSGIVMVDVDKTGKVTGAKMAQSTGDPRLDALALKKFKQWRFEAGKTAPHVRIPVTFYVPGAKH
jgi:TonB family protein